MSEANEAIAGVTYVLRTYVYEDGTFDQRITGTFEEDGWAYTGWMPALDIVNDVFGGRRMLEHNCEVIL